MPTPGAIISVLHNNFYEIEDPSSKPINRMCSSKKDNLQLSLLLLY